MYAVAFDFDGVLCDSSREVFVVGSEAYLSLEPTSALAAHLRQFRDDAVGGGEGFRSDPLYRRFIDLLPLGNRAEDFGVSLTAIDRGLEISDQPGYDAVYKSIDPDWLQRYHAEFYVRRGRLRDADPTAWTELHLPYPGLADALGNQTSAKLAVATAKDGPSVELLLDTLGFGSIFDPRLILDKETGVQKTRHLQVLSDRLGIPLDHITFIDDKVNHLRTVAALGVRPVLAGWGFNTPREHRVAREFGYEIAELETAGAVLFKGE
jgi:phosphoglycolate phosphatase-like HAD superfamily hydrolase